MMSVSALIEFLMNLMRDDNAKAEFDQNPQGTLDKHGLGDVSGQDIRDARLIMADDGGVRHKSGHHGSGSGSGSRGDDPVREIHHTTTNYVINEGTAVGEITVINIDDRDTTVVDSFNSADTTDVDVTAIQDKSTNIHNTDIDITDTGKDSSGGKDTDKDSSGGKDDPDKSEPGDKTASEEPGAGNSPSDGTHTDGPPGGVPTDGDPTGGAHGGPDSGDTHGGPDSGGAHGGPDGTLHSDPFDPVDSGPVDAEPVHADPVDSGHGLDPIDSGPVDGIDPIDSEPVVDDPHLDAAAI